MSKKVLIIEDEKPLRDVYALILTHEGYEVATAENGQIGITQLESFKPSLILLDMLMPVMDGIKFLKTVKFPSNYPDTKILVISNLNDPLNAKQAKQYGVHDSFVKVNLSPNQLAGMVKKHLPLVETTP
jgi:CheY-like chemotaxis protein